MFYKGIILDLDNTLYDYNFCHNKALSGVFYSLIQHNNTLNFQNLKCVYSKISENLKVELNLTASSHNKNIYFKQLLEYLNIELYVLSQINNLYWEIFYKNMTCFAGVKDFLAFNKKIGKKIGILTDYETEYQIAKLDKLGLFENIDVVVTSEEVGIEKPSEKMFHTILNKMNLSSCEVIMIGDNFDKDIKGAINNNIFSYWFNIAQKNTSCENYISFSSFTTLHLKFNEMREELVHLKNLSKYCGERFDLVQAGGGNSSVKVDDFMCIKSSGNNLANVDENSGYVTVNNKILMEDINNQSVKDILTYNIIGEKRGSIETFMHSILKKYTIHLHPIQVNRVLVSTRAREIVKEIYPNSLIIEYFTPGIKLCNQIKEMFNGESVIFLLNHGLIITSDKVSELYNLLDDVCGKFEYYQNIDFSRYRNTNVISRLINRLFNVDNLSYLCEDQVINKYLNKNIELFKKSIAFPDCLIYCGVRILLDIDEIEEYKKRYDEPPKVIIDNKCIYICSHSITKCREIEDVFKAHLIIMDSNFIPNYLSNDEVCFIKNWDAEKYRFEYDVTKI